MSNMDLPQSMRDEIELQQRPENQLALRRIMKASMMSMNHGKEIEYEAPALPGPDDDIEVNHLNKSYPGHALSVMAPYPFQLMGEVAMSLEGFLQGIKFKDQEMQRDGFSLFGQKARKFGAKKDWKKHQRVYFKGHPIDRNSPEYQCLLDAVFDALSENKRFMEALKDTGEACLMDSTALHDPYNTLLTEDELCDRYETLRRGEKCSKFPWAVPTQKSTDDTYTMDDGIKEHEYSYEVFCKHQGHLVNQGITMCNAGHDPSKCETCEYRCPETVTGVVKYTSVEFNDGK